MSIKRLSDELINQIAAGEVVERPASVVKELIENSLDAQASQITIILKEGGRELIQVIDDGHGINTDELELAVTRHATSKISTAADLEHIRSFGFRGEALASIAAVSELQLRSREPRSDFGYEVSVSFGLLTPPQKIGMAVGTDLKISRLFSQLPARLKFLKTASTEMKHVNAVVTSFALANPQVSFVLRHESRELLNVPKTDSVEDRLHQLWGNEQTSRLVPVFFEHPHLMIRGFVSKPDMSGKLVEQWLFVNRRWVDDRTIQAAVRDGYGGLLPPKARPFFVLYVSVPEHMVDVNVHPRKEEVRFASQSFVYTSVKSAVQSALGEFDMTPHISHKLPGNYEQPVPAHVSLATNHLKQSSPDKKPLAYRRRWDGDYTQNIEQESRLSFVRDAEPLPWELVHADSGKNTPPRFFVLDNVYIFVSAPGGVIIYDQHALHERQRYEQLKSTYDQNIAASNTQTLLIPIKMILDPLQYSVFEAQKDFLAKLGFEIREVTERQIEVLAVPVELKDTSLSQLIPSVLEDWQEVDNLTAHKDIALATLACRSAVKAGDKLSDAEIGHLLQSVSGLDEKYTCPHGRPFKVFVSTKEIDKWFKRTGFD